MSTSSISTADQLSGSTPITSLPSDIIQSDILSRLDGCTLTSTICASPELRSLCSQDQLWRDICNATWPSTAHHRVRDAVSAFPAGHRSFYADAFPSARHDSCRHVIDTSELISAVDVFYGDDLIYSKVMETETLSCRFLSSPFKLELLDPKEMISVPKTFELERLRVSWILIDPAANRAVNVAGGKGEFQLYDSSSENEHLRYGTIVDDGEGEPVHCGVVVTLSRDEGGETNVIKEVNLQVENLEGDILGGMDSLVIFMRAMEGQRRRKSDNVGEDKDIFQKFIKTKPQFERKQRRVAILDVAMRIGVWVSIFVAILMVVIW